MRLQWEHDNNHENYETMRQKFAKEWEEKTGFTEQIEELSDEIHSLHRNSIDDQPTSDETWQSDEITIGEIRQSIRQ